MSQRRTWAQMKNLIGNPVGLCGTNANLLSYANEGAAALWDAGDWIGKHARYKLRVSSDCANNQYIVWPRFIEAIDGFTLSNSPIGIRNAYFEFIENATGQLDGCTHKATLLGDRQEVCTQEEIIPGSKKVKILAQRAEDADLEVLILGYDDDGVWIRTLVNSVWVDGEYLSVNTTGDTTANFFSAITGIQFSEALRNGNAYLTEVDTLNANAERTIGTYQYDEQIPVFRSSILSGVSGTAEDCDEDAPCNENSCCGCIVVLARMRYIPFANDTDFPQISNVGALKCMLQYIYKRDNDKDNALNYFKEAERLMNNELKQYNGTGAIKTIAFANREIIGTARNIM